MLQFAPAQDVAHAIQLAVAPVFLLTGVGAILSVLTQRLARVIDRARVLHQRLEGVTDERDAIERELRILGLRGRHIQRAIGLCTCCALLICAVVAALFVAEFLPLRLGLLISVLFVVAMICLFAALLSFLREVFLATASVRIGL